MQNNSPAEWKKQPKKKSKGMEHRLEEFLDKPENQNKSRWTTVMIRNIPSSYSQKNLVDEVFSTGCTPNFVYKSTPKIAPKAKKASKIAPKAKNKRANLAPKGKKLANLAAKEKNTPKIAPTKAPEIAPKAKNQ